MDIRVNGSPAASTGYRLVSAMHAADRLVQDNLPVRIELGSP